MSTFQTIHITELHRVCNINNPSDKIKNVPFLQINENEQLMNA